jgi:hypothetical protein
MNIIEKIEKNKIKKTKEINKILNLDINYIISFDNNKIILYDKNKKKILVANYIFYGIYQNDKKLWIWSNSIPGVSKKQINIIRDIKNKAYLFENDLDKKCQYLYQLLNNDVLQITKIKKLNLIIDVLLFLSNSKVILTPLNKYGNIQYIGLTDILENYT